MKSSRYNFFFDGDDGQKLAFNAFTTGLAVLPQDEYRTVQNILKNPNNFQFNSKKKRELRDDLKKGGFLIEDEDDEFAILKVRNRMDRFKTSHFGLTIVPTLNCNFNCMYCYEDKKNHTMNERVEKALVEFVRERTKECKFFGVSWYGGEPTLRFEQMKRLTKEFKAICKKNRCSYSAGIISNGYLLDRDMAKALKRMSIRSIQITIDGPKDIHDRMRPLKNGKGTFDRIFENIRNIADILKISIRVNTDKNNRERVLEILDHIERIGLKGKVSVYFAPVTSYTEACLGVAKNCYTTPEFAELEVSLYKKLIERGFSSPYPQLYIGSTCTADRLNSFVLTPKGDLFKCWTEVAFSKENSVGHLLHDSTPLQRKNLRKWLLWDPYENENCIDCKMLPICNGGCPYLGYKMREENKGSEKCVIWRYNLEKTLQLAYLRFYNEKKGGGKQERVK